MNNPKANVTVKPGRIYDSWTSEDFQRLNKLNLSRKLIAVSMVRKGDRVDYQVMLRLAAQQVKA